MADLKLALQKIRDLLGENKINPATGNVVPATPANLALDEERRGLIRDELCLQRLSDRRLEPVIATLSPGCVTGESVLKRIETLIDGAISRVGAGHICVEPEILPPPTNEDSLEFFNDVGSQARQLGLPRGLKT